MLRSSGIIAFTLAASAFAGDTSTGVGHSIEEWPQARWGMTESQVLRAFEGAAKKLPSPQSSPEFKGRVGTIAIDDVAVGGVELRALFLFDRAGKLNGIQLAPPDSTSPTDEQFRKIEDSLARKYREPLRWGDRSRFLSVWMLSRSAVELDYSRLVSLSVRFDDKTVQSARNDHGGLAVVRGKHVFPEPLTLPAWLIPFPHEQDGQSTAEAGHLHIAYDTNAQFQYVATHYENVLHKASGAGVTFSENAYYGGVLFRASQSRTVCTVEITSRNAHVDLDCVLNPETPASAAVSPARAGQLTLPVGVHRVEYKVDGSARIVGATYRNATGGTEQNDAALPAGTTFYAATGTFVYLSAQNKSDIGEVHVVVLVDGHILQEATSSTAYGIATASGRVP